MRLLRFLRRINQPEGDVASDDWAPVPVSATAAPESWGDWLSEKEVEQRPKKPDDPIARKDYGSISRSNYEQSLTPEERAIIEVQKQKPAVQAKPVRKKRPSTYEQHLTPEERAIIESQKATVTPTKRRKRRPDTEELIRDFGSHLTEEERRIIEEQQSGDRLS